MRILLVEDEAPAVKVLAKGLREEAYAVDVAMDGEKALEQAGLTDYDLEEAEFARTVLSRGTRSIAITDAAKFGKRGLVQVCGFGGFGELVTDQEPPADILQALHAAGTVVNIAGK